MPDALLSAIRTVPDFPKPGVLFKDLTPILADPRLFVEAIDRLAAPFLDDEITHVVGMEARGFWFGPALALRLGAGFVPARKPGKLPARTLSADYALEYGSDTLEIHADAFGPDPSQVRVLLHDDVIATGGTAGAVTSLINQAGATVVACSFMIELHALGGRAKLPDGMRVETVVDVD